MQKNAANRNDVWRETDESLEEARNRLKQGIHAVRVCLRSMAMRGHQYPSVERAKSLIQAITNFEASNRVPRHSGGESEGHLMDIAAQYIGQTFRVGDDITMSVLDVAVGKACLGVVAPAEALIYSEEDRRLATGASMRIAYWRIGEILKIGDHVAVTLLATQGEKAWIGISAPSGVTVRAGKLRHLVGDKRTPGDMSDDTPVGLQPTAPSD